MNDPKKILFLIPYPPKSAPSQRYRFEQYFELLEAQGFDLTISPFFNQRVWDILYRKGGWLQKILGTLEGYFIHLGSKFPVSSTPIENLPVSIVYNFSYILISENKFCFPEIIEISTVSYHESR